MTDKKKIKNQTTPMSRKIVHNFVFFNAVHFDLMVPFSLWFLDLISEKENMMKSESIMSFYLK